GSEPMIPVRQRAARRPLGCGRGKYGAIAWGLVAIAVALTSEAFGADDPIYKQDPYDQVTVDEKGSNTIVKIQPLVGLGSPRTIPEQRPGINRIRVRLADDDDEQEFDIYWKDIKKIELFEQLVLGEARQLTEAKKFDEAWEVLKFLQDRYPT